MIAATVFDFYKKRHLFHAEQMHMLAIGFVVSFIVAWIAVKFFIHFLGRHTLAPFGWYRLVLAGGVLWFCF
jgi:undecaprenyl-diphosphatase